MLKQLFIKELIKIRYSFLFALFFVLFVDFAYYTHISQEFASIEPKTMLWHRVIHLGFLTFEDLAFVPLILAVIISLAQTMPENISKKFRITLHLPIQEKLSIVFLALCGLGFLLILNAVFIGLVFFSVKVFYPTEIAIQTFWGLLNYTFVSFGLFGLIFSVIIDPLVKRKIFFIILAVLFANLALQNIDSSYKFSSLLASAFFGFIFLLSIFISLVDYKKNRLFLFYSQDLFANVAFFLSLFSMVFFLSQTLPQTYKKLFNDPSKALYLFYSPIDKNFVYQAHYGNHVFIWGNELNQTFSQKEFEQKLPFHYYKDLDIQHKLPIRINEQVFSKNTIKKNRQSFEILSRDVDKKIIPLYPLFNSDFSVGSIAFSDYFFKIQDGFIILDGDTNDVDKDQSELFTKALNAKGFSYPAKLIAGKPTNLKPFDEGYFIQDAKDVIFHVKKVNSKPVVIKTPIKVHAKYIKIVESRTREFYGALLDENGKFYFISYDNYKLIPVDLEGYDYKKSNLEFRRDPLYKSFRYTKNGLGVIKTFDENYNYLGSFEKQIPTDKNIFSQNFDMFFGFGFDKNSFFLGNFSSIVFALILAAIFWLYSLAMGIKLQISKLIFIAIFGIYAFLIAFLV